MSIKAPSFCIRPSNNKLRGQKAINPMKAESDSCEPQTESEPIRQDGSAKGLVIRASSNDSKSIEDYH